MRIFAISDPHLSLGTPDKSMAVFGAQWADHPERMARQWREVVEPDDVVIVAGDISWAMNLDQARIDLEFLGALPGLKVLIRGNHDYWWSSISKVRSALPAGMFALQNDAVELGGVAFAGTRLWDDPELEMGTLPLREPEAPGGPPIEHEPVERTERIFTRELGRLQMALDRLPPDVPSIAVVHYPPLGTGLEPTRASSLIESSGVDHCVFGHLHALAPRATTPLFGPARGVSYWLTSCDYLDFIPIEIHFGREGLPR